jgi:hypothetical protein
MKHRSIKLVNTVMCSWSRMSKTGLCELCVQPHGTWDPSWSSINLAPSWCHFKYIYTSWLNCLVNTEHMTYWNVLRYLFLCSSVNHYIIGPVRKIQSKYMSKITITKLVCFQIPVSRQSLRSLCLMEICILHYHHVDWW